MDAEIRRELVRIRRRRLLLLAIVVGYLPCFFAVTFGLKQLGIDPDPFYPYMLLPYAGIFLATGFRISRTRCPRCGELFCMWMSGRMGNVWASRCVHCGLSVSEPATPQNPRSLDTKEAS
jgi:hypothetical protein